MELGTTRLECIEEQFAQPPENEQPLLNTGDSSDNKEGDLNNGVQLGTYSPTGFNCLEILATVSPADRYTESTPKPSASSERVKYSELAITFLCDCMQIGREVLCQREGIDIMMIWNSLVNRTSKYFIGYIDITGESYGQGVVLVDTKLIQLSQYETNGCEVIIADLETMGMVRLIANSMKSELEEMGMDGWEENGCIDLERTGRRWEGGVLNGECYGYGKEYNDENYLVYEGFLFGRRRVCYGKEYRGIRNKNGLVYEGGYWNGVRYGFGKAYDLNGDVEYEGEWVDNNPINMVDNIHLIMDEEDLMVPTITEELQLIYDDDDSDSKMIDTRSFSPFLDRLKRIEIDDGCLKHHREFVLDGLEKLESVKIGKECFNAHWEKGEDHLFRIANCPNLRDLDIGDESFMHFKRFELSNVNLLKSIRICDHCFVNGRTFVLDGLDGLDGLERVDIGEMCFNSSLEENGDSLFRITNCPNLRSLNIGRVQSVYFIRTIETPTRSLEASHCSDRVIQNVHGFVLERLEKLESVMIGEWSFRRSSITDNVLRIMSCPNLRKLDIRNNCFDCFDRLELYNLNSLQTIEFGPECFMNVHKFVLIGLNKLESVKIGEKCFRVLQGENEDCVFRITHCPNLRKLDVGNNCFDWFDRFEWSINNDQCAQNEDKYVKYIYKFVLDGLEKLKSVKIGTKCFSISQGKNGDTLFRIANCPNLRDLDIEDESFMHFKRFEVSSVNSLQFLKIGRECFENVREFVLDGLEKLESVMIGLKNCKSSMANNYCNLQRGLCPDPCLLDFGIDRYRWTDHIDLSYSQRIDSFPLGLWGPEKSEKSEKSEKLQIAKKGKKCFKTSGGENEYCLFRIANCPNLRKLGIGAFGSDCFNRFELLNVNLLQSIHFGDNCFKNVREFVLDGLAKLDSLDIGDKCFNASLEEGEESLFRIANCPRFRRLGIGRKNCMHFNRFELSNVGFLQSIEIVRGQFENVYEFVLDGLENLVSVKIGDGCFTSSLKTFDDRPFRITNCPNLREVDIGRESCRYFNRFELSNGNLLQSIRIDKECFKSVHEFVLDGLESLESVKIGEWSFRNSNEIDANCLFRITNCPNLRSLEMEDRCFEFFAQFELSRVSALQFISFGMHSFSYASCTLKDIPKLTLNSICSRKNEFRYTSTLKATNATALENFIRKKSVYLKKKA